MVSPLVSLNPQGHSIECPWRFYYNRIVPNFRRPPRSSLRFYLLKSARETLESDKPSPDVSLLKEIVFDILKNCNNYQHLFSVTWSGHFCGTHARRPAPALKTFSPPCIYMAKSEAISPASNVLLLPIERYHQGRDRVSKSIYESQGASFLSRSRLKWSFH